MNWLTVFALDKQKDLFCVFVYPTVFLDFTCRFFLSQIVTSFDKIKSLSALFIFLLTLRVVLRSET